MQFTSIKRGIAIVWIMAVIGLTIDAAQREEESMKTLLVSVEVTDAQFLALEKMAKRDAQDEAQLIASAAITAKTDAVLKETADEIETLVKESEIVLSEAQTLASEAESLVTEMKEAVDGKLTAYAGVFIGPSGKETWYNLPMEGVINTMRNMGYAEDDYPYWVRDDGCKMFGPYILGAANLEIRPRGTIIETSLGEMIVADTGNFAIANPTAVDIAVAW